MEKAIFFTDHAECKLLLLDRHGFKIFKQDIRDILRAPHRLLSGYAGRKIAERLITKDHTMRVVFEESPSAIKVITMYPARRNRYEN